MTRIIGGTAGGRRIETPKGDATRPTSDRVREALFSAIESWCGPLQGLRFLDLYAGSGAVGLEAWSRGAIAVTLVEQDRRSAQVISKNAQMLHCQIATVVAGSVTRTLQRRPASAFDVVFSDPPYDLSDDDVHADLRLLLDIGWVSPEALIVLERRSRRRSEWVWPAGIEAGAHKRYGETSLWFGHVSDAIHAHDTTDEGEA